MTDDPLVAEVRRTRAALWSQAGETFSGLTELLERRAAEREAFGGTAPAVQPGPTGAPRRATDGAAA